MRPGQRHAEVEAAAPLRARVVARPVERKPGRPLDALLVVDRAQRAADVGVGELGLGREQPGESGAHVLRVGQRVDVVEEGNVVGPLQPARRVVDEQLVVPQAQGQALAAALGRSEQVVEVGLVPGQPRTPFQVLRLHVQVRPFVAAGAVRIGRERDRGIQGRPLDGVAEVEAIADAGDVLVALQHGVGAVQAHVLDRLVRPAAEDQLVRVHRRRRRHLPGRDHGVARSNLGTEEVDRTDIADWLGVDDRGCEALASVGQNQHAAVGQLLRAEEARLRIRHRLDRAIGHLIAEDVGSAGVVAAAVQVAPVAREGEALRDRLAELEFAERRHVAGEQLVHLPDADELVGIDFADRCRQQPAVGRDVQVRWHHAIGQGADVAPVVVGERDVHQRRQAIVVAHADQGAVLGVEGELADARIPEQHALHAGLHVERHQVAFGGVVVGEEDGAAGRIERERGDPVQDRLLDVGQRPVAAVAGVDGADLRQRAGREEGPVQRSRRLVVEGARDRADGGALQRLEWGDRMLAHLGKVALLELLLERDPLVPGTFERQAEDMLELVGIVTPAAGIAAQPGHHLLRRVSIGEPGDEARAIKVGVGANLEVHPHPLGHQAQRVIERRLVAHHGAEDHLVVPALGAAQAAGHPGFHEHRAALEEPARRRKARCRQVVVEQRLRVPGLRRHLAAEQAAPEALLVRRGVTGGHMDQLVVRQAVEPLRGSEGLEGHRQRGDVEDQRIARRDPGRPSSEIGEILQ